MNQSPSLDKRSKTAVLLGVATLIAAACGTTVPQAQQAASAAQQGLTASSLIPPGAHVNSKGEILKNGKVIGTVPASAGQSSASGEQGAPGTDGNTATGTLDSDTGLEAAAAPGITATKIYVGAAYVKNQGAANAALGAGGLDEGDRRQMYNVMIRRINSQGGLAGRKVVPVYFGYDAQSSQTADQQDQGACAKWTQDNKVFAIFGSDSVIDECAAKAGAVEVNSYRLGSASVPEDYQRFPLRIDVNTLNMVRMGPVTVDGLYKYGYFDKGAKVGIVTWDDPNYRESITKGYAPALAHHGLSFADHYYVAVPQTFQDFGATSAAVSNAVLRFKSEGIDHVMILDGAAGVCGGFCITLEWVQDAHSQQYYPRYGFNTDNSPEAGYQAGLIPRDEIRRTVAVVWSDGDKSADVGSHTNTHRELCYKLMRKHGIDMGNANARGAALEACDSLWFLQDVIDRIRGTLTANSFVATVNGLGYDYASPITYTDYFSAARHDGVGAARVYHYVNSCDCFRYLTKPYRI